MNAMIGVKARIALARLMLLTGIRPGPGEHDDADPARPGAGHDVVDAGALPGLLAAVIDAGVDLVQVREPAPDAAGSAAFHAAADVVARHDALLIVGDWTGTATDIGADAICLPPSAAGPQPGAVRDRLGPSTGLGPYTRLGAVATDPGALQRLLADPLVDFVLVDAGTDLGLVAAAAASAPVGAAGSKPWFAAGEFDLPRLERAVRAGARRIAVSTTLTRAADPTAVTAGLAQRLTAVWNADPTLTRLTFAALADQG